MSRRPADPATRRCFAVVAGGGTGGHVLPALAVARALVERGHDRSSIEMVGSARGQEATLLAGAGFALTLLPGRGIARSLSPSALRRNVVAVAGLVSAVVRAVAAVARWRPAVVVSVGGYASFPAGAAAVVLRVPLVLVNVDAVPGLVHKVLARFAAASAVALPGTPLPRSVVTGAPVREEISAVQRSPESSAAARVAFGLPPDRPVVAVFGGSLGAGRINEAVEALAKRWSGRADVVLYHATGRRNWEQFAGHGDDLWRLVPFVDDMARLYEAATVCVCRSGAITVAELTAAGVPSLLVPLPGSPGDHQGANARALVAAGAAVEVPDDQCDGDRLDLELSALLADPGRLEAMAVAARGLGRPDAADQVAALVESHAR